jgi:hypothetical protein
MALRRQLNMREGTCLMSWPWRELTIVTFKHVTSQLARRHGPKTETDNTRPTKEPHKIHNTPTNNTKGTMIDGGALIHSTMRVRPAAKARHRHVGIV